MKTSAKSQAKMTPPWYVGRSQCKDVYRGEEHWAVLADNCLGIVADVEGGMTAKAKATAEFIVRACNAHEELVEALDYLLAQTVDMDLAFGIELTEGEREARRKALATIQKACGKAA